MAEVLDSPASSPLSSPIASRKVMSIGLVDACSIKRNLLTGNVCGAEVDPFEFHDSDNGDDDLRHQQQSKAAASQLRPQHVDNLFVNESSQQSFVSQANRSQHSQATEMMTQNAEFTQMTQEDLEYSQSPFPSNSPAKPQKVPWGRLMPCYGDKAMDLLPRAPDSEETTSVRMKAQRGPLFSMMGLEKLRPSNIFNCYTLGRSSKCDISRPKPQASNKHQKRLHEANVWAWSLVSNRHCRIYCTLPEDPARARSLPGSSSLPASCVEVWIEDSSNNGTMINQSILLRKGQKRRLHSGDEVSLINHQTLRKKARDDADAQAVMKEYSFIFVNVTHQQQPAKRKARQSLAKSKLDQIFPMPPMNTNLTNSAKRRAGLVNVRAMNYPPSRGYIKPSGGLNLSSSPLARSQHMGKPTPKSANGNGSVGGFPKQQNSSSSMTMYPKRPELDAAFSPRRIEQDYDIRDLLGRGTCGEVRRAIHRQTGIERAVKIISLPSPGLLSNKRHGDSKQWQAEAKILRTLQHPYIVQLVDVFSTDAHLYLVMELCAGGDLFDKIIQTNKYSEENSRRVMRRLFSAVHYLHSCEIAHRDLKPENILLTGASDPCDVKITDFGVAKSASSGLKTFCGTPLYFAPEVLKRRHTVFGKGTYGKEADMWSLGIILYILLSGTPPYDIDGAQGMDVLLHSSMKIQFPLKHWASVSAEAKDLVNKMLTKEPEARITIKQACEHPWILIDDGDTHRHPLEDPKLISLTRKRLFDSDSPMPSPSKSAVSLQKQPAKKKPRKISLETRNSGITPVRGEPQKGESGAEIPSDVSYPQKPDNNISPLETSMFASHVATPCLEGKPEGSPVREKEKAEQVHKEGSKEGQPTGNSLLSKVLLSCNQVPSEAPEADAPMNKQQISHDREGGVANSSTSSKPQPNYATREVDESSPAETGDVANIDRKESSPPSSSTTTRPKVTPRGSESGVTPGEQDNQSKPNKKRQRNPKLKNKEGMVMAAELEDDKICSQFSDEDESISSFGDDEDKQKLKPATAPKKALKAAPDTKIEKGASKQKTSKGVKPGGRKKISTKAASTASGSKQMTLSNWFVSSKNNAKKD